jgi:hypothetical protein
MTSLTESGTRVLATIFGLLMVGAAVVGSHEPGLIAGAAAVLAVGIGVVFRPIATLAVLLVVLAIVVSDPSPALVAFSGICATAYLVCRHATGPTAGSILGSVPTLIGALGFSFAGLVAISFPLQLPWVPLAAPLVVLGIYVLATRPFVG